MQNLGYNLREISMSLYKEFHRMVTVLSTDYQIPKIDRLFLPPFIEGGQPRDSEFMAVTLKGGATGISYVLVPDREKSIYCSIRGSDYIGKAPLTMALKFGSSTAVDNMLGLAAVNAICRHIFKVIDYNFDFTGDSLGMLDIKEHDSVGMVGLFPPLIKRVREKGASLTIIEKKKKLINENPEINVTLDPGELKHCNKVLCTSTTVNNNTIDEILSHCKKDAKVSVIGPTAGFFPDPLFKRGVDVVGGNLICDSEAFMLRLENRKKWGETARKFCFTKESYKQIIDFDT